ncbi:MAG: polysaccharide pyruvyl transferase family protein [Endomicrobia bacterium]|nr:polysaccharide pyruvyl transferase family protein [Endomicrobiia bacterium]
MNRILIVGYFGFSNFGDEWLLINLIKLIKKFATTKIDINVLYNIKKCKIVDDICYIPRWNLFWLFKIVYKVNNVVYCGGLFQDYTSILSFFYYLFIFLLAKLFFKRIILLNTEFSFKKIPYFIVYVLSYLSNFVVLRNKIELEKIKRHIKNKNKFKFSPDICYIEENNKDVLFSRSFKKVALIIKSGEKDVNLVKNFCKSLADRYRLVFIPFHLKEDYEFSLEIVKQIKNCEIRIWDKIENYKYMFDDIDLVITSRLHGVIISDNLKLPFICFSLQEKIRNFILSIYKTDCISLRGLNIESLENFVIYPNLKNDFCYQIEKIFKHLGRLRYI